MFFPTYCLPAASTPEVIYDTNAAGILGTWAVAKLLAEPAGISAHFFSSYALLRKDIGFRPGVFINLGGCLGIAAFNILQLTLGVALKQLANQSVYTKALSKILIGKAIFDSLATAILKIREIASHSVHCRDENHRNFYISNTLTACLKVATAAFVLYRGSALLRSY